MSLEVIWVRNLDHCHLASGAWNFGPSVPERGVLGFKKKHETTVNKKIHFLFINNGQPQSPSMLPEKMKAILLHQARIANPLQDWERDGFSEQLHRYERYSSFLDACGHNTRELAGAIAGVKAAVEELRRAQGVAVQNFDRSPFPFADGATEIRLK